MIIANLISFATYFCLIPECDVYLLQLNSQKLTVEFEQS